MSPRQQGEVPNDGTDRCFQADILRLAHPCDVVLSTAVQMRDKVSILGEKSCTCAKTSKSSRPLMVKSPLGFMSVTSLSCVACENGGAPDEPLAFLVLVDTAHAQS